MLTVTLGSQHPYVYGIVQRDWNSESQANINGINTRWAYNSDYIGCGSTGSLSDHLQYGVEGVFECGNTLSASAEVEPNTFELVQVAQTRNNINAYAADAKIDYVPQDAHNSRISIEGIVASGDPDRGLTNTASNGNTPNTPDNAFNSFGLVSTGLAFGAPVSNLAILRVGASCFPFIRSDSLRRMQVGMDVYWFNKCQANAPIDESTNPATYLGWEPDFYINWEVLSDLTLTFRYGLFDPNLKAFGNDKWRQFLYTGAVIAF